jgi:hypothetical protein
VRLRRAGGSFTRPEGSIPCRHTYCIGRAAREIEERGSNCNHALGL